MAPRVWLPAIVVFFVVMLLAGLRLTSPVPHAKTNKSKAVHADSNVARELLRRLSGPPTSEEDHRP